MMSRGLGVAGVLIGLLGVHAGCGGDSDSDDKGTGGAAGAAANGGSGGSAGAAGTSGSAGSSGTAGSGGSAGAVSGNCGSPVPAGASEALDPPSYSGGTCPTLVAGANTIQSGGASRAFLLALPSNIQAGESLPVVFLWHWLGGDANDFLTKGEVQAAVDTQRFIAVLPEKKGDVLFTWPVESFQSQARVDEEAKFFDDMLACVAAQFSINKNCVSTVGVSAGALWSGVLAGSRSDRLASFISLSGGVGGAIRPWANPAHKLPAIVLWGGPTDSCAGVFSFETLSHTLEDELTQDGHFFLECIHNCGHSEPPFEGPSGTSKYHGLWQFVLDHPYWLPAGASPYNSTSLPAGLPTWCGIGKGSATPREGTCASGSQC